MLVMHGSEFFRWSRQSAQLAICSRPASPSTATRLRTPATSSKLRIRLSPPPDTQLLRSSAGVVRWLHEGGIVLLEDLSVAATATRAAMGCLNPLSRNYCRRWVPLSRSSESWSGPILNFDFDQLFNLQHFSSLEQSFSKVVLLNDAFPAKLVYVGVKQLCIFKLVA